MKSIVAYSALLLASLSSMVSADLGVGPLPKSINSGEEVDVKYWMGEEYAEYKMQLVMKTDYGWEGQGVIVHDTHRGSGNKTYKWEVEDVRVPGPPYQYAIYIDGTNKGTPAEGGETTGYADLSNWFEINNAPHPKGPLGGAIAGIVVGILALCAAIAGAVFLVLRRRRASRRTQEMVPQAEWRGSVDSIAEQKERARVAMSETKA